MFFFLLIFNFKESVEMLYRITCMSSEGEKSNRKHIIKLSIFFLLCVKNLAVCR